MRGRFDAGNAPGSTTVRAHTHQRKAHNDYAPQWVTTEWPLLHLWSLHIASDMVLRCAGVGRCVGMRVPNSDPDMRKL